MPGRTRRPPASTFVPPSAGPAHTPDGGAGNQAAVDAMGGGEESGGGFLSWMSSLFGGNDQEDDPGMNPLVFGRAGAAGRENLVQTQMGRAYDAGASAPHVDFDGTVHRAVPTSRWEGYVDHRHSDRGGGRYNDPGNRLIYTSPSAAESIGELSAYDGMANQTRVELGYNADGRMADVAGNMGELGLTREALTQRGGKHGPNWFHQLMGEDPYAHTRAVGQGAMDSGASSMHVPSATGGSQIDIIPGGTDPSQVQYQQHTHYDAAGNPGAATVDPGHLHQHAGPGGVGVMPDGDAYYPANHPGLTDPDYAANSSGRTDRASSVRYAAAAAGGMSLIENGIAFSNGEIDGYDLVGDTALDTGMGAVTGLADDALSTRFGGGMSGGLKAGAVIDAVTSGAMSTWNNADAYRDGDVSASQATANVAVDTGVGVASGLAGAAAGAAIGSVIPVAGTAVGAAIGFGAGMLGSWLTSTALNESGFSDWAKEGLGGLLGNYDETLSGAWDGISDATEWMGDTAGEAWDGTKEFLGDTGSAIADGAGALWEGAGDVASGVGGALADGAGAVGDWVSGWW